MNETKTPSKIKNSEETENDEDDDALKHVNLFSKYQNRSLKFGDGTFFSRTENVDYVANTHTMKWKTHNHTYTMEMKHTHTHNHTYNEMTHTHTHTHTNRTPRRCRGGIITRCD